MAREGAWSRAPFLRTGPRRVLVACALAAVVASTLVHLQTPDGTVGDVSYLIPLGVAAVLAWVGAAGRAPERRRPWRLVALGTTLTAVADLAYLVVEWTTGAEPDVSVADPLWFGSYVALALGLVGLTRQRTAGQGVDIDAVVDCLVGAVVATLVLWEVALADLVGDGSTSWSTRLVWASYPLLDVVLLALLIRALLADRGRRTHSLSLFTAGVACWLVADFGYLVAGGGAADRWLDLGWMVALLLLASAALWWVDADELSARPDDAVAGGRMWLIMVPLVVPGLFELSGYLAGEDTNPAGTLTATVALMMLITVRGHRLLQEAENARAAVQARESYFRALAANSADAVIVLDPEARAIEGSGGLAGLLGIDVDAVRGANALSQRALVDEPAVRTILDRALAEPGVVIEQEVQVRHGAGGRRWLGARVVNLLDDASVGGIVVNLHDVSDRKRIEAQLEHQAFHDPLTGVANRALLINRIEQALRRGARTAADPAVIFLDVDSFKAVNDRFGHDGGDRVLSEVAHRLTTTVRTEDTVARLGGDEFAVLVEDNHAQAGEASTLAERIVQAMSEPMVVGDQVVQVTASIGVAVGGPTSTASSLLRDADIAMYRAKAGGKDRVVVYDTDMGAEAGESLRMEADLAVALASGQLELYYQPVVDLGDERVVGFEALLRWWHPRLGLVTPDRFIPTAEETGLIVPIGRWVLQTACATAVRWQHGDPDSRLTMAVNVSARQLLSDDVIDHVSEALTASGLDASCLVLEMTESALVADPDEAARRLQALNGLGVRLAIDDFGTGYSSLSYLRQFPVDILKIDRSFVDTIVDDAHLPPIVRGLLDLGHTLDLEIVAEGIELDVQRAWLRRERCDLGQGFLFSRPLPAADVERLFVPAPSASQAS